MRYEDTSGSISSSSAPDAHDDADTLANGSNGPASGNVITGAGTTTGKAGADSPQSGHVVAVRGASGTDSSDNGASLHVDGRFGTLVMDEHGNYKYVADGHAPANFRDLFQYTLADSKGGRSVADLVISRGGEIKVSDNAQKVIPGPDGVVTLPAGVDLNDVHVVGRDLVINMPDGSQIVIVDGAVFVPQLVLGGVEVPSTNLAALLIDAEPRPAAGTPQSGGGSFEVPVSPLDPGVPLGDLIPPTELVFTPPSFKEVFTVLDRQPTITIQPDNQPASVAAVDDVNEKGLPTRNGGEPAGSGEIADGNGSNNSDASETIAGTIVIDSPDGVGSVMINGVLVTGVAGQTISGAFGTLTITGFNGQNILYSYTLADNTSGNSTHDDFSVTVTDPDGDQATATLTIDIIDDVPTARPDTDAVAAGTFGPETGNVLTGVGTTSGPGGADTVGADDAHISGVTGFNGSVDTDSTGGFVVNGQYGVLTLQSDGSYSYTRNPGTPGGVNDVFNYTLTDGDGDTSTTTLTISIGDSTPHAGENPTALLDDDALAGGNPGGTGDDPDSANTSGTLAGGGGDGPVAFAIQTTGAPSGFTYVSGGAGIILVQQGGVTVLTVTVSSTSGAYTVVQNAPIDHPAGSDENNQLFTINYTVTDQDGDSATGTLTINVDDDTPLAFSDTDTTNPATDTAAGNVITGVDTNEGAANADKPGADGFASISNLVGFNGSSDSDPTGGFSVNGQFGTLQMDASGNYTYARTPGTPGGAVDTFTYTYLDGDGDPATATLTITISDNTPIAGNVNVGLDDDALAGGNPGGTGDDPDSSNATGTLPGSGGDAPLTFGVSLTGAPAGFTYVSGGTGIVLVQQGGVTVLTVTVDSTTGAYSVVQNAPINHAPGGDENNQEFTINYTVTDSDSDVASGTISISVDDDTPTITLSGTQASLTVDETVLATNDTQGFASAFNSSFGADGAGTVTYALNVLSAGANSGLVDSATGQAIVLVQNGAVVEGHVGNAAGALAFTVSVDSSGNVTLDQIRALQHPNALNPDDSVTLSADNLVTLTATVTDKDGDSRSATLNIGQNLNFEDDGPTAHNDTDTITNGGTVASGNVITGVGTNEGTGNADSSGADAPAHVTAIQGSGGTDTTFSAGLLSIGGSHGTLSIDADGNYTYSRTDSVAGTVTDTFTYTLTDADGDSVTATLIISMTDNAPNAPANVTVLLDDDTQANGIAGGPGDRTPDTQNTTGTLVATGGDGDLDYFISASQSLPTGFTSSLNTVAGVQTLQISQNGTLVITVTLTNETGDYTVTQNAPIVHALDGNTEGEIPVGNILSAINVSVFAQDADGDPGPNGTISISVDDDTPTVTASTIQPPLTVDETILTTNASADFSTVFTHAFGADGAAAANSVTYTLGINAGATGLTDVATGSPIVLVLNGNTVEGHVLNSGGPIAFTVSVSATGTVTLDQVRALSHPNASDPDDSVTLASDNLVTLTQTVTDKDGDQASATANIGQNLNFEDDGPSVSASTTQPTLTVDETVLATNATANFAGVFTSAFGADGAGTITYALGITGANGVASGLTDTATGSPIVLVLNGNVVEGHVGTTGGPLAFTVNVDASGNVTLDQIRAVVHTSADNPDTSEPATLSADNLVTLTATVTDKDGDHQSATANIGQNLSFLDDGPTLGAVQSQQTDNNPATAPAVGTLHFTPGADGAGSTMTITANVTGLKSGGFNLVTAQSGNVLTAYQDTNGDGIHQVGESTVVFTLTVDPSAGTSGQYTFDLVTPLDPTITDTPIGGSSSFGAGPTGFQVLDSATAQHLSVLTGYNTTGTFNEATWLATGNLTSAMITDAGINGSTTGWGVDNNVFSGTNEFMFFDFGAQPLADPDGPGGIDTSTSGATLPNISTATFDFIQYTTADDITYVVHYTDGTFDSGHVPTANMDASGPNWTFTADAGKFIADIQLYTSGTGPGKVDLVSVGVQTSSLDKSISASVQLTDGDGDPTSVGNFTIHIATGLVPFSPAAPVVLDLNGDGVHFLSADAGVAYDYGHGGVATAWASPQDGILVNDSNHDGNVSASEFVFGSGSVTDLQALAAHDTNGDGQLSSADADFGNFAVWQDANSNGAVDAGELQSLTARGIASISLSTDGISYSAAGGDVQVAGTGSYTRTDGSTGVLADAAFLTESRSATNSVLMGALAAAGLAAESSAAATTVAALAATTALTGIAAQHNQAFAPVALDAMGSTNAGDLLAGTGAAPAATQAAAFHAADAGAANGLSVAGGESQPNQGPTELLQGSAPVQDNNGAGISTAASIIMPSAAQLAAADAGVGGAQHNQVVGQVLADALHGGGSGPDIDSVLSSLPSQGGAHNAALETLASQAGAAVPNGDNGAFAGFTAANAAFTMEHMVFHVDAAPSHA